MSSLKNGWFHNCRQRGRCSLLTTSSPAEGVIEDDQQIKCEHQAGWWSSVGDLISVMEREQIAASMQARERKKELERLEREMLEREEQNPGYDGSSVDESNYKLLSRG
eukprot:Selendium_serpulae@DN7207_c0_g1_i1.p1